MSKFEIIFYEKEDGTMPAQDFLDSLDDKMRAKMILTVDMLKTNGNRLREPYSKPLDDGIMELRAVVGTNISRVLYFFVVGQKVILTNGFIKKTQKTPKREITLAKKYREDYLERERKKQEEENNEDFYSKLRFGATGGMGLYLGRPAMFQIRGGVDARMPFILPHAYLMAGSRLSLRGCSPVPFEKLRTLYLEVPVRLGYTLPLDDNLAFFVEAGPYLDVRLIRFKKHDTSCARFLDLGLGGDAGLELGHKFRFSLGLDFGFIPPCTGEHAHNNGIWLSGAYLF